jgi:hypothetical protein
MRILLIPIQIALTLFLILLGLAAVAIPVGIPLYIALNVGWGQHSPAENPFPDK